MSAERVLSVMLASHSALADELAAALGIAVARVAPEMLGDLSAGLGAIEGAVDRIAWIHLAPLLFPGQQEQNELVEADLLLRSAAAARATATARAAKLTFMCLLPSRGLYAGPQGLSCELARGAMEGLMRQGIAEWSAVGARIVGLVHGGLSEHAGAGQRPSDEVRQRVPMGRLGTVDELADAVRYLGSESASYVTGTFLHVDGGWNAYSWIYPARTI